MHETGRVYDTDLEEILQYQRDTSEQFAQTQRRKAAKELRLCDHARFFSF